MMWSQWVSLPALAPGVVYIMGWSYAHAFYEKFNLSLLSIDIPPSYYMVHGFQVLRDHWWWLILIYLAIFAVLVWKKHYIQRFQHFFVALLPILVLLAFVGSYQLASYTAHQHFYQSQQNNYAAYNRVKVWLKAGASNNAELEKMDQQGLAKGCYRLLLQSGGEDLQLFLFHPDSTHLQAHLPTLQLPAEEIQGLQILSEQDIKC